MDKTEVMYMLCWRTTHDPTVPSHVRKCVECDQDVWVSNESLKLVGERSATFICDVCIHEKIEKEKGTAELLPMSQGQMDEILRAGMH